MIVVESRPRFSKPKSIHTGGIAFLATTLFGGLAGIIAAIPVLISMYERRGPGPWAALSLLIGHVAGAIGFAGGAVAVLCLILFNQTLARSFHLILGMGLAWIVVIAGFGGVEFASQRRWVSAGDYEWTLHAAAPLVLVGLVLSWWSGRNTSGFSRRARMRGALGLLLGLAMGATAYVYVVRPGAMAVGVPRDFVPLALVVLAAAGLSGAMIGALFGADRIQERGFAVLPALPVSELRSQ